MIRDKWTILLTGEYNGLVGVLGSNFPTSPEHYPRVDVITIEQHKRELKVLEVLEADNKLLRVEIEKWKRRYQSRHGYEQSMDTYDEWFNEAGI